MGVGYIPKRDATGNRVQDVATAIEKNDKTLRTICAFQTTDADGKAEFCIPIPGAKRFVAYGDAEFENREFGDYISIMEVADLDRLIAWQMALAADPEAIAPVDDSVVQANGYPRYPSLGWYDEREFPDPMPANAKGTIRGGMTMTFKYGVTEAQPVGGYGELPGGMYFRVVCQKKTAAAGEACQLSIDWAEPNA